MYNQHIFSVWVPTGTRPVAQQAKPTNENCDHARHHFTPTRPALQPHPAQNAAFIPHSSGSASAPSPDLLPTPPSLKLGSASASSPGATLSDETNAPSQNQRLTSNDLLRMYLDGLLERRISDSDVWELKCPACHEFINSGVFMSAIAPKLTSGYFATLAAHSYSKKCRKTSLLKISEIEMRQESLARQNLLPPQPPLLQGSAAIASLRHHGAPAVQNPQPIRLQAEGARNTPVNATVTNSSLNVNGPLPSPMVDSEPRAARTQCHGIVVSWPEDLKPFNATFPWARIGPGADCLPFWLTVTEHGSVVRAISKTCRQSYVYLPLFGEGCAECAKMVNRIDTLVRIAREAPRHTNYQFLNHEQLCALIRERDAELRKLRRVQVAPSPSESNPGSSEIQGQGTRKKRRVHDLLVDSVKDEPNA
ncbi:hypothetical protein HGRIS_004042 [Hohenbuehelia grisea]|uniref:Uncharacterized protein n=1 Tax=Hohenbuehelia grisea TaxID=104357 RepID=A0ABR3JHD5_9AGAR